MQERLPISRQVVRIAIGMFVVAYGTNVSTPFLVLYKDRLDLSASQTMAIFVVYVVGILASLVLGGALSDRFGRRPIVLPIMALSGIASVGMIFGRDEFIALLVSRLLLGAASGAVLGVGAAWLLELFGPGNEHRAALTTTLVSFAGFGGGGPVSALFYWLFPAPLILPFVLHVVAVVGAILVVWPVGETHRAKPGHRMRPSFGVPVAARRAFLLVILPAVIWMFAFPSMGFALFPVLISDSVEGGEVAIAAAAGAITAWGGLGAKPIVGRLGGRVALPIGMACGTLGYVVGTIAFLSNRWPLVLVAAPLLGVASGVITMSCLALAGGMATNEQRGSLTSTVYLLGYPGMTMPLIVTSIGSALTTSTALVMVTIVAAAATVFVFFAGTRSGALAVGNTAG